MSAVHDALRDACRLIEVILESRTAIAANAPNLDEWRVLAGTGGAVGQTPADSTCTIHKLGVCECDVGMLCLANPPRFPRKP